MGKSSLVNAALGVNLRVGAVSDAHSKGRHTTTSARRYMLDGEAGGGGGGGGGAVIDTPGIKVFGLTIDEDALIGYFPDVESDTAPAWRVESFERIRESLTSARD